MKNNSRHLVAMSILASDAEPRWPTGADDNLRFSTSHTTRERRSQETDGEDYYFVDEEKFAEMVRDGEFLEWAHYGSQRYGTSRSSLVGPISQGFDLLHRTS